jgi:hypothetical protein
LRRPLKSDQLRIAIKIDAGQSAAGRGADRKADDSIPKGNLLDYTREIAFNSELPGMRRTCITDFDIFDADGIVALLWSACTIARHHEKVEDVAGKWSARQSAVCLCRRSVRVNR